MFLGSVWNDLQKCSNLSQFWKACATNLNQGLLILCSTVCIMEFELLILDWIDHLGSEKYCVFQQMRVISQCPVRRLRTGSRRLHFKGALWHRSGLHHHQTRTAKQINNSVCILTLLFCLVAIIHSFFFYSRSVFTFTHDWCVVLFLIIIIKLCSVLIISFLALLWEKS